MLKIEDLRKYYKVAANEIFGGGEGRVVKANETISFEARESETVAIVGESGCGKSTLAKVLLGLETASVRHASRSATRRSSRPASRSATSKTVSSIQMVFQNPFDTLNPSHSVGSQIIRTLEKFKIGKTVAERRKRMLELLDLVKLPRAFETRMPRQLSGGQKQRIGVARAFAGHAKVVVADEPVSALDVSVQAAVTELLMDIQRESKTTMLFISHDLSVVRYIADRVVVMYLGHIVEQGTTDQIFSPPYHPYTEALLSAIPIADTSVVKKHIVLEGDIPSAMNPPTGCPFQTRCRYKHAGAGQAVRERSAAAQAISATATRACAGCPTRCLPTMEPVISFARRRRRAAARHRAGGSPQRHWPVGTRPRPTDAARAQGASRADGRGRRPAEEAAAGRREAARRRRRVSSSIALHAALPCESPRLKPIQPA